MAIGYDTKAQGSGTANPLTLSYTCGASAKVLVLGIAIEASTRSGGAPTYNGITMTQAGTTQTQATYNTTSELWYLLSPPTGSAYNISVPNTGAKQLYLIASSYTSSSSVALDVTNGNTGYSTNASVSVTTTANGDVVVDMLAKYYTNTTLTPSKTLLYNNAAASNAAQYDLQASAGSDTMTWTISATDYWALCVAAFKEVTAGVVINPFPEGAFCGIGRGMARRM